MGLEIRTQGIKHFAIHIQVSLSAGGHGTKKVPTVNKIHCRVTQISVPLHRPSLASLQVRAKFLVWDRTATEHAQNSHTCRKSSTLKVPA